MAIKPTYPGVYVQEVPSGVRTITGVSTSVTAFVGYTSKGPVNTPKRVFNFGEFERDFGGLSKDSLVSYGVQQFFQNGGSEAWIVRAASGAVKAAVALENGTTGGAIRVLTVTALSEGVWGNYLRLDVDYATTNPDSTFNLVISEYTPSGGELTLGRVETYRNLSMDQESRRYAVNVVNAASEIVALERHSDVDSTVLGGLDAGWSLSGDLSGGFTLDNSTRFISIVVDGDGPYEIPIFPEGSAPANLNDLRAALESAIQGINPGQDRFSSFTVERADATGSADATGNYLLLTSGTPGSDPSREQSSVRVMNASSNDAARTLSLGLANGGREREAAASLRPAQTGTVSGDLATLDVTTLNDTDLIDVTIADGSTQIGTGSISLGTGLTTLSGLADRLESRIQAIAPSQKAFSQTTVEVVGTQLRVLAGTTEYPCATVTLADDGGTVAADMELDSGNEEVNVKAYAVGTGVDRGAQIDAVSGDNGTPPGASELKGSLANKSGVYALEDVDIFNILCIPETSELAESPALSVIAEAIAYCEDQRAFYIVDPPKNEDTVSEVESWVTDKLTVSNYGAVYYPWIKIADPLDEFRLAPFPPSGTIAGLYARIDSNRGVWKAPAGTEATLSGVQALAYPLTENEVGVLNQVGINCLRQLPVYGLLCWGARTLEGADQQASEWKYVPVRRLALYIEESLYRGTQWVVFEPNDEPLWAQIRLNVGAFMQTLFRQGAFQGTSPRDAFFVKCDSETTTQDDINRGIVNILVGFAPLKPAEFVILKIQQMAGQSQT